MTATPKFAASSSWMLAITGTEVFARSMQLQKLEHATLIITKGQDRLVIDPGKFTRLVDATDVTAVVITHLHDDHWSPQQLSHILTRNPKARLFGPAGVVQAAEGFEVELVAPGDIMTVGQFRLNFFGGEHAVIHSSIPKIDNVGVLVDENLYYPGDSLYVPAGRKINVLAAPAGAPWEKIGECMDFVLATAPKKVFATHDALLSPIGINMWRMRIESCVRPTGGVLLSLNPGDEERL